MTPELSGLYHELVLDHGKRPRNFRRMEGETNHAEGYNPLCGDRIVLQLKVENGVLRDLSFQGAGCAISTASASLMTEALRGKTRAQAEEMFDRFHRLVTEEPPKAEELGKLAVFAGVREYPMRVKCATLPWHTMRAALAESKEPVSTE
jgi:nitrogen fixation NifU-like protein